MRFSVVVLALPLAFGLSALCDASPKPGVAEEPVHADVVKTKVSLKDTAALAETASKPASVGASNAKATKIQGIPRDVHLHEKVAPDLTAYDLWKYELCL